jgi:futalosine hydrolase
MLLLVSATKNELEPLQAVSRDLDEHLRFLISGVGPVETALKLSEYLASDEQKKLSAVINIGLAGAYPDGGAELLDICLAENELFGDIGINISEKIEPLDSSFAPPAEFALDHQLLTVAGRSLERAEIKYRSGNFVTVSSTSGTVARGKYLQDKFKAICENMEGAAVARVCQNFALPCLEIRCVSNMVINRSDQRWLATEAAESCGQAVKIVLEGLVS